MKIATFNGVKRFFDLAAVAISSPLTIPLGAVTALLVRIKLGTPIFFSQPRVGLGEREFSVLKFRTMTDARDEAGRPLPDSDRLTAFGRILRASSLDEIPQLLNVARGDMSLVGPRPLFVRYLPHYIGEEARRHDVRPGITGLAQVSGRNSVGWDQRLAYDAEYVRRASLVGDLKILASTLLQVAGGKNVSVLASDSGEPLDVERSYPSDELLRLRRLRATDLELRVEWIRDARIRDHMQWPDDVTIESTRRWFETARRDRSRIDYAAETLEGVVVAMAGLRRSEEGSAEFYVFVEPEEQGQGWGRRVTEMVLRHGFEQWGVNAVTLTVANANRAATSIYSSLGFQTVRSDDERLWMKLERP